MAVNKVIANGSTLIDLTSDTVQADKIFKGYTAHDKSGKKITGTFDPNTLTDFDGGTPYTTNYDYDMNGGGS